MIILIGESAEVIRQFDKEFFLHVHDGDPSTFSVVIPDSGPWEGVTYLLTPEERHLILRRVNEADIVVFGGQGVDNG